MTEQFECAISVKNYRLLSTLLLHVEWHDNIHYLENKTIGKTLTKLYFFQIIGK